MTKNLRAYPTVPAPQLLSVSQRLGFKLTGRYDFTLDYTLDLSRIPLPPPPDGVSPAQAGPSVDSKPEPGADLAWAVEKQLGLKLNRAKAPFDMIVVDHADKVPTDN